MCQTGVIQDETECNIATESIRTTTLYPMVFIDTNDAYPKGCYLYIYGQDQKIAGAYFNRASYGRTNSKARPVCRQGKHLQGN